MRLWLLRHGEAEPRARTDAERNLTEGGRRDVRRSATFLRGKPLQTVLVSPFQRAQQTADEVCKALAFSGQRETVDWATPESDLAQALRGLDLRSENDLLLVTHQPFVGNLAGWLINGHYADPLPMATASLAELEGEAIAGGLMRLVSLHHVG
ncbi:phosphohistidine phosphatase SixA [Stutzerimonas decontaminans]|uniref:Phosphohistidine phosphatase SixA n=2 Tax=Stutzerimonas TaxID=2901164 RepID=A0ABX4VUS1_9GAMM|nr:phosphohistidine phosphatase SixA [Stutzerimonas decontaminans]AHY43257.1 phosphohistidine phosphatase [Stutzerimonas decontaminans]MCQ4246865.1 phosphohistidine phosphatase SixA [Stutzerimonas decontaminans]PNF83708.1 phosphohistidine phosphatase SixA [Stutzerimonas decontaminans]